ncbi:MAG: Rpn family recombination-promoting nuclease/putative transposase [Defluviitaleaceae bacterium]|nr:Rpn family recombination-promoting nuclease/putative transposase [Defluviitaleaceae bacterium]
MSRATHSLEAGSNFLSHKKARQARTGHRGHISESAHSLEAGSNFLSHKKARETGAGKPRPACFAAFRRDRACFAGSKGLVMESNRKYKDSIIRAMLNNPQSALKLYCDISGCIYNEDTRVEMKSVDVQFHPKLRNDVSFEVDGRLVVFLEHQSTLNKNMPLRLLQYFLAFLATYYKIGTALYADRLRKRKKINFTHS